ncbi:response regulator [Gilvibacter sp.]|uniref:response regulator n=1 Tax=Gilvibacter sp. TaxID=2729997 RepID=UPI0025B912E6|nr:response regulator [Gilvibacter sp.]NQX77996.1 response regulator [Gilvibacter sp.]
MKTLEILLLEDDQIEIMKLQRAFKKLGATHKVIPVNNGEEALSYLNETSRLPDLIFLDLNMPRLNGLEFLAILKADDRMKFLPTVVLTTSSNEKDLFSCYEIGVAGYVLKPLQYQDYVDRLGALLTYWEHNEIVKPVVA